MCVRGAASTNSTTRTGWWLLARLLKDRACMIRLSAVFLFIYLSIASLNLRGRRWMAGVRRILRVTAFSFWLDDAFYPLMQIPVKKKSRDFLQRISITHSKSIQPVFFSFFLFWLISDSSEIPLRKLGPDSLRYGLIGSFFFREKGKELVQYIFLVHLIDGWSLFAVDLWISQKKGKEKSHAAKNRITGRTRICLLLLSTCFFSQ